MRALWPTVVVPLLDALRPSAIIEFGDDARFTEMLEAAAAAFEGSVLPGDPLPSEVAAAELALIHGEPNWYSVSDRLDQLAAISAGSDAPFPVTLVHGVDWPTGRRDSYPNPSAIPIDARQPLRTVDGEDRALDRHDLRNGVLTAVEDFLDRYEDDDVDAIHVPGLGGVAILVSGRRLKGKGSRPLTRLIAGWRLSPLVLEQIATIESERVRAVEELNQLQAELDAARSGQAIQSAAVQDEWRRHLEKLAARNAELTEELARQGARAAAGDEGGYGTRSATGLQLRDVNAPQPLGDPSQPLPLDRKGILLGADAPARDGAEPLHAIISVNGETDPLRRCIWSLLARCDRPLRLTLVLGPESDADLRGLVDAISAAEPLIRVTRNEPDDDSSEWRLRVTEPVTFSHQAVQHLLAAAGEAPHPVGALAVETLGTPAWAGPDALALLLAGERRGEAGLLAAAPCTATSPGITAAPAGTIALDAVVSGSGAGNETAGSMILAELGDALSGERELSAALRLRLADPLAVAYVLPGLPEGGSGGTHSIFQEALALDSLGARVRVLVSREFAERAEGLYPEADGLVCPYSSPQEFGAALEGFDVVVATEAPSTRLVAEHVRRSTGVLGAYYVQDYEPLFSPGRSPSADTALLSYRRAEGLLLFAKTDWIGNVVGSAHAVPVAKVSPSLDHSVFNASGRKVEPAPVRVAAMIRPRTPRRRAAETLSALTRLKNELGDRVECLAFGCSSEELEALPGGDGIECLNLLSRDQVAQLLRRSDLFLDLSSYQAFGRTGLEAMACGCVPLLPAVGGVAEYAVADWNALLVDTEDEDAVTAAATSLIEDNDRLERLRRNGLQTAESFSPVRAASSQYACFAAKRAAIEPS